MKLWILIIWFAVEQGGPPVVVGSHASKIGCEVSGLSFLEQVEKTARYDSRKNPRFICIPKNP